MFVIVFVFCICLRSCLFVGQVMFSFGLEGFEKKLVNVLNVCDGWMGASVKEKVVKEV